MKGYFLDTNFIYGLLIERDALHEKATKLFENLLEESAVMYTSVIVLAELLSSNEPTDFHAATKALTEDLLHIDEVHIDFIDEKIPPSKRRSLKANDMLILASAKLHDLELITFDKKLLRAFEEIK